MNNFDNIFEKLKGVQPLSSSNANNVPPQNAAQNMNINTINKDNIFQQANLLQGFSKPEPVHNDLKGKAQSDKGAVDAGATHKFNDFLNNLGFKIGDLPPQKTTDTTSVDLQPLEIAIRAQEGIYLVNDQEKDYLNDKSKLIHPSGSVTQFNQDGTLLAFASQSVLGVNIVGTQKIMTFNISNVLAVSFSPGQRYLTSIEKRDNGKYYLSIFEPDPLRKLFEFETTRYKKETWPQLKFTQNDELAFWASKPTQIEVFNPRDNFRILRTIDTKAFDFFDISVNLENLLIVTVSLEKSAGYHGHEGRIDIFKYQDLTKEPKPFVSKTIDKAHEVQLFFSPTGQNLLLWAQTFMDRTGESYYGEHMLLYLDVNRKTLKRVPTYKGPIHDVAWNPNGMEFIAISGFMPAGSVLYDSFSVPKFEFGRHPRNTVKWSPLSRFVCLAGFGNLPGDMEFWDVYSLKQIGTCKSGSAVSCRWAPDGRRILTGVLNPRLRVSNNYKIFKYNGELLQHVDFSKTELYEVLWRPARYHDRPASPMKQPKKLDDGAKSEKSESDKSETMSTQSDNPEPGKKMFRPKGVGSFAAQIKAERTLKAEGRHLEPDEIFGNESNLEEIGEKKVVEGGEKEPEKKEEEKKTTKIMRRNDKRLEEENKDNQEKIANNNGNNGNYNGNNNGNNNNVEQKREPPR